MYTYILYLCFGDKTFYLYFGYILQISNENKLLQNKYMTFEKIVIMCMNYIASYENIYFVNIYYIHSDHFNFFCSLYLSTRYFQLLIVRYFSFLNYFR